MEIVKNMTVFYSYYLRPVLDVLVLSFLIYKSYKILLKTQAIQLIKGALSILLIYAVAIIFKLNTLLWLLNALAPGLLIAVAIVFQPELRKIFLRIGQTNWLKTGKRSRHSHIDSLVTAAEILSEKRRGMLVVFMRKNNIKDIVETGTVLNATLSASLLVTIFGHDTPLHDGAVVAQDGMIISAGCFLPLSEQYDIKKSFGTRHRAALGMTEETDSVVLIVSEESGALSLAYDSKLYYDLSAQEVAKQLEHLLEAKAHFNESKFNNLEEGLANED